MIVLAIILILSYTALYVFLWNRVLKGDLKAVLIYSVIFFPVYTLFLAISYSSTDSHALVKILQYSKELLIFGAVGILLFSKGNLLARQWHISRLDWFFLAFVGLAFIFLLLPLSEATKVNQAIYFKNILLIGVFYFLGRQVHISFEDWQKVFNIILGLFLVIFVVSVFEKVGGRHIHSFLGYVKYNQEVRDVPPTGAFGLTWTFAAQGDKPRYASLFANPLELASAMLLGIALPLILLVSSKYKQNKLKYLFYVIAALITLFIAYSRASFVAAFMMLVFAAFLMRYYQLIKVSFGLGLVMAVYVMLFASEDLRYFILDTITFENSSSVTHIIDWLNAINSMISNPMGIGLAMSGNAGGVEKDMIVGGENQYLIYGVQMGFLGMFLYLGMLYLGIRNSWRAFRWAESREAGVVPFVTACVKFGLLLPLFTANAEVYIFISWVTWWMMGSAETSYQGLRASRRQLRLQQLKPTVG